MPHSRSDWILYIRAVSKEYGSARLAVDHVQNQLRDDAHYMDGTLTRDEIAHVSRYLEGTYIVRMFAAFESALRSYERWWHPTRTRRERPDAATMIDEIGAHKEDNVAPRRKREIGLQIRARVHEARQTRNYWAHDDKDQIELPLTIDQLTSRLLAYIQKMPLEWG